MSYIAGIKPNIKNKQSWFNHYPLTVTSISSVSNLCNVWGILRYCDGGTRLNGAKGAEEESWDNNRLSLKRRGRTRRGRGRCSPHSPSQFSPSHDQSTNSSHRVNGRAAVEEWMDGGGGGQAGGTYTKRERRGDDLSEAFAWSLAATAFSLGLWFAG